jgi:hypothetical protein
MVPWPSYLYIYPSWTDILAYYTDRITDVTGISIGDEPLVFTSPEELCVHLSRLHFYPLSACKGALCTFTSGSGMRRHGLKQCYFFRQSMTYSLAASWNDKVANGLNSRR